MVEKIKEEEKVFDEVLGLGVHIATTRSVQVFGLENLKDLADDDVEIEKETIEGMRPDYLAYKFIKGVKFFCLLTEEEYEEARK